MRDRWQTVSNLWEANRAAANRIDLVQQLDYYGKLLSQLEWQHNKVYRPLRDGVHRGISGISLLLQR